MWLVRPIRLISPAPIIPGMNQDGDLISVGLIEVARAVSDVIAMANLHLGPKKLTRRLAQRAGGRLRLLETIVRRLITLMALSVRLQPAIPRAEETPANATPPAALPDWLPEGTVIAEFPRAYPRRLRMLPRTQQFDLSGSFLGQLRATIRATGPVSPLRLMARIAALQRVLAAPQAHAKRLACHLALLQKAGEPRPMVGPAQSAYRLWPELGALSTALPGLLTAALESWDNSS